VRGWGRNPNCTAMRVPRKTRKVTAIAGTVRRISSPAVIPTASAKTTYPIGTIPRSANIAGCNRPLLIEVLDHLVSIRLSSPQTTAPATAIVPTLTASQRVRG
jgi:hypothetical protein